MSTATSTDIPPEVAAELRETLADLMNGVRRPEKVRAACDRMDRLREENRRLFGEQNVAVELIRQTRAGE